MKTLKDFEFLPEKLSVGELSKEEITVELSERELIEKVKSGDPVAIRFLVAKYQKQVFGVVMQYTNNREEAYDLFQDVFYAIFQKIASFEYRSKFSTWVYSVTLFICKNYIRKLSRRNEISIDGINNLDDDIENSRGSAEWLHENSVKSDNMMQLSPEVQLIDKEKSRMINQAILELPVNYKRVFILKELEGLSIKEIKEMLGISESNIKIRLYRAKKMLQKSLEKHFPEISLNNN